MLSVLLKPFVQSVIMLNVIILSVVAPWNVHERSYKQASLLATALVTKVEFSIRLDHGPVRITALREPLLKGKGSDQLTSLLR